MNAGGASPTGEGSGGMGDLVSGGMIGTGISAGADVEASVLVSGSHSNLASGAGFLTSVIMAI